MYEDVNVIDRQVWGKVKHIYICASVCLGGTREHDGTIE